MTTTSPADATRASSSAASSPADAVVRDLRTLPKGHLHLHMEAAIRPDSLADMASASGVVVPMPTSFGDFSEFSATYQGMLVVLAERENLFRLIDEAVEDCALDGVAYVEFGASPQFYVATFGSLDASLRAMLAACAESGERWGVEVGLMITVDRTENVEAANELAHLAAAYADRGVVSLGLANDERGNPAARYEEAFRIAKHAGLLSTPHAGELAGPDQIEEALDVLGADRVLHGVTAVHSETLMARLAAEGVCLDVCLTSNVLLSVIPTIEDHPLKRLLEAGVRCSINADDPILFGPGVLAEYELARTTLGLSDEQLAACALSSIECSGASEELKGRVADEIAAWLAA
ncbi:adenosine deaminase [Frigoribacterium sp. PhB24]|uniref:adenosine deaminase n=1 Tax=Frigoribacterium sp. PhB24 TaxID=2485204 RepID=UPI000FBEED2C|nr:adenosine deaminase [Frigoribacterium sp. PhB24]ROS48450.1 adenosine deaminase [Frigoribacterium sp. PhB24]